MIGKFKYSIFILLFINPAFSQSIQGLTGGTETSTDAATGISIKRIPGIENVCAKYVKKTLKKKVGWNTRKDGMKYYIGVGKSGILAPPSDPTYIESRQNAYEMSMMQAKGKIVEGMKTSVARSITLSLAQGQFKNKPELKDKLNKAIQTEAMTPSDTQDANSAYNKAMKLLNIKLDKEIAKEKPKPIPAPKNVKEAEKQMEKIVKEKLGKSFSDFVETVASSNLIGVRRLYVHETIPPGAQGNMCVALLHSPTTKAIARAVIAQDASMFPTGKPNPNFKKMIPNPDTDTGLIELISTFGVDVIRDNLGNYVLVSYGQSMVASNSEVAREVAVESAITSAYANLRSYLGEVVNTNRKLEKIESYKEFADNSKKFNGSKAFAQEVKSISKSLDIVGMENTADVWGIVHPVTNHEMVGTWVTLSSASITQSKNNTRDMNSPNSSGSNSSEKADYSTVKKGFSGGSRKPDDDDF